MCGEVTAIGSGVSNVRAGDRVAVEPLIVCGTCFSCRAGDYQLCPQFQVAGNSVDGGFAEYVRMPAYALFGLPKEVDDEIGALTEPLAVTVHAARMAPIRMGNRVLILGAGTIGLLAVAAAKAAGAGDVWITARHPQQASVAMALGATRVFSGTAAAGEVSAAGHEQPIDVVIETVGGMADTLSDAVHLARRGGTVVVLGIFATSPSISALALVIKEVRLVGSMTYGRSGTRADFDIAIDLLGRAPERYRPLVTHRYRLSEIGLGFETASDKGSGSIKVAIEP
jgi:threonine dehydrogenase-like Zn-dependent dehydrogenase